MRAILVRARVVIDAIEAHPGLSAAGVEFRLHRREAGGKHDRFFIETYIGGDGAITTVVILCVPSVVPILVQEWLVVRAPVSFARYLAATVEDIDDPVNSGIAFQGRFIGSVKVGFLQLVPIGIVFPFNDRVTARDDDGLAVAADERR